MHCTKKITDDLFWVGGDDRRLAMFEGVYSVPTGVSYNSYLLMDESTVLFDTVDRAVSDVFFQNIAHTLGGRTLNFVVVHHMEPDHSGTLAELILRHPSVVVVCNQKTANMLEQFFELKIQTYVVDEKSEFCTGPMIPQTKSSSPPMPSVHLAHSTAQCSPTKSTSSVTIWTSYAVTTATSWANTVHRCSPYSKKSLLSISR